MQTLPWRELLPPPPPVELELLFHSKMAAALEPLVSGCIFALVVVSVSNDFWHILPGNSTRNPGYACC
ncbi:hypothetical protein SKAU_G00010040 [Synaphobranchus kaupii]|uniref:Uncharacterized protein n=1 Tax=Synaphobranchus kaupii TaxID=118154 RepID=A0A9Q1GB03_SYNKA|nr:hypothetical protein SKAU_G00010040 [Synaphobranchus kaupii]